MNRSIYHYGLLLFLSIIHTSTYAQSEFQALFNSPERPLKKEIVIHLEDDQGRSARLPVAVLRGKEEGPVFTMVAGVHGFEYPPIVAVQKLLQQLDPDDLKGTLIIIPIANTGSFFTRTPFINPTDGKNLNGAFPGVENGSVTQILAHYITENIIPVSDVFLDIHGGDACEDLIPFVCYYDNKNKPKQTQLARDLSEQSGFDLVVSYPYTITDDEPAKYTFKQAVQDGKTALSIECGRLGQVEDQAVQAIVDGVYNMLTRMEMYPSKTDAIPAPSVLSQQTYIRSSSEGIFYSQKRAGDSIAKGDIVGHTKDFFGRVLEEYKAPEDGIILYMLATPPINEGDTVMCIGSP